MPASSTRVSSTPRSQTLRAGAFTAAAALVTIVTACASRNQPEQVTAATPACDGTPVLVVRNNLESDVEILASRAGSGERAVIAIVGPGLTEVPIRTQRGFSYYARAVGGRAAVSATSRRGRAAIQLVSMETTCRTP